MVGAAVLRIRPSIGFCNGFLVFSAVIFYVGHAVFLLGSVLLSMSLLYNFKCEVIDCNFYSRKIFKAETLVELLKRNHLSC